MGFSWQAQYCAFCTVLLRPAGGGGRGIPVTSLIVCCLVLESREFDLLLGQLMPDGTRAPGLIDKFGGEKHIPIVISRTS